MSARRIRVVLFPLALSLTLALTAAGTSSADEAHGRDASGSTSPAPVDPAAPAAILRTAPFTAGDTCTDVPAGARTATHDAVRACIRVRSRPSAKAGTALPSQAARTPAAAATHGPTDSGAKRNGEASKGPRGLPGDEAEPDDPAGDGISTEFEPDTDDPEPPAPSCRITEPGTWSWSRTGGMCLNGAEVTYTLYDANSVVIGRGLIAVNSSLATSYRSLELKETITAKVIRVEGDVQSLTVRMKVGCGTGCKTVTKQPWYARTLALNGEATGTTKYNGGEFAAGSTRSSFQTDYTMYVSMPGGEPIDAEASWPSPAGAKIRCDAEQPRLRGCVIPTDDPPVLSYSRSHAKYGLVVPIYEAVMTRRGTNLLHAVDQAQAGANRAATCSSFTNLYPAVRGKDSCDEFPMASTREGGQAGALCAELTPQFDANGVWSAPATWPNRPTTNTETCLRLHISQSANSSAGGVLGALRKYQRLITDDPFRIEFTA
ncbi:hypothetical protein ABT160_25720 [Streptomyces sp. NPDC001941]|uniref:NucA/NucB deoxyribonuclease domain-containing protein n=1 Tax=Streptomyces sp. NPDC001941 TaxID=3154659 RepID=UPI00331F06B7